MQSMQFNPDEFIPDQNALAVLTEQDARRLTVLPLSLSSCGTQLEIAISEPAKSYGINLSLDAILKELSDGNSETPSEINSPIVRLVDAIIQDAVVQRASDIHLSPKTQHVRVRYRVDGVLFESTCIDKVYWPAILVHLKVQSGMDIAETRQPQDGQVSRLVCGIRTDFRVASFPVNTGENVVMRVLEHRRSHLQIHEISGHSWLVKARPGRSVGWRGA